jgi:hypothetical protein
VNRARGIENVHFLNENLLLNVAAIFGKSCSSLFVCTSTAGHPETNVQFLLECAWKSTSNFGRSSISSRFVAQTTGWLPLSGVADSLFKSSPRREILALPSMTPKHNPACGLPG